MSESGDLMRMDIERKDNLNLNLITKKLLGIFFVTALHSSRTPHIYLIT